MRNEQASNESRLPAIASIVVISLAFAVPQAALAVNQCFACDGSALTAAKWGPAGGPYTVNFTNGNVANFTVVNGTTLGSAQIMVGGLNATESLTHTATGGPAGSGGPMSTGGMVVPVTVASGKLLDLGVTVSFTGTGGFIKNGPGAFATVGGAYTGGFTLNEGTVILRTSSAMGAGNALIINGGAIGADAKRNMSGLYPGGIAIGSDFQLGVLSSAVSIAASAANLTFNNSMSLGAMTRTITIGSDGTNTLGGSISGNAGVGLTVTRLPGANGTLVLSGPQTYPGATTVLGGVLELATGATLGSGSNTVAIARGANMRLADGVNVTVGYLYLDGASMPVGTLGSQQSPSTHRDDTCFSGVGVLTVTRCTYGGTVFMVY